MPVICTRNRNPSYQPITQRIPQKKQEENKVSDAETFRTFGVRSSVTSSLSSNTSKFLVGTALPNSTAKERLSRKEVFEPRRPTIESLRLAIEKAKKETNKNMGTEDISAGVSLNDAATLTEKKKKKVVKKKKAPGSPTQSTGSSRASASSSAKAKEPNAVKKKVESDTLQLKMKMKTTVKK
nr:unnamed protein product [Callosobruchus analis]